MLPHSLLQAKRDRTADQTTVNGVPLSRFCFLFSPLFRPAAWKSLLSAAHPACCSRGSMPPSVANATPPAPASPPTDAHVSLGLLVAYESMSWCPAPEPAPKKSYAVSAPPDRPPMPERPQVPVLPELPQVPLLTSILKCPLLMSTLKCPLLTSAHQSLLLVSAPESPRSQSTPESPQESAIRECPPGLLSPQENWVGPHGCLKVCVAKVSQTPLF